MTDFFFDETQLSGLAEREAAGYADASPFPHAVLEGLVPEALLDAVLNEFPRPDSEAWRRYADKHQRKLANEVEARFGPATRHVVSLFNSSAFLTFLERLTGIDGLIPDPHLRGGGLHQIERGGHLEVHADFNFYPRLRLERRLNVLLYLNRDWREDYGGQLELWNEDMTRCERSVLPTFNRCVVFSTNERSYHGHPRPLTCPEGQTRKSLAFYYYTNGRPEEERARPHTTLFQTRPGSRAPWSELMTRLRPRGGRHA